jgi:hypothetical protein
MDLLSSYQVENKKYEIIPPKVHGVIDYLVVVFLVLSPKAFGLTGYVGAFTYALAGAYLLLALLTDYNAGLFKRLDFSLHGKIEFMVSEILIILAYTFFYHVPAAKMFYQAFGSALLLIWLLTHYKNAPIPLVD